MNDRELDLFRKAYRQLLDRKGGTPPPDEKLAALVADELQGDERKQVVSQLLESSDAIRNHRILEELHAQKTSRPSRMPAWTLAAGLAAGVLVSVVLWNAENTPSSPDLHEALRSRDLTVSPPSGAKLPALPTEFEWNHRSEGAEYRVKLRNAAAKIVWHSEPTRGNQIKVPQAIRQHVRDDGLYHWTVEGLRSGQAFKLGPFSFEVTERKSPSHLR